MLFCLQIMAGACWGQSYFLNGTAISMGSDCYQLTTTQGNQNGTVWYADLIQLDAPFDLNFTMNFGTLDASGADGMVFVLQDVGTDALGASGGALGFNGFNPSFGIEFDTWLNGQYGDLAEDHIGFVSDGTVNHAPPTGLGGPVTARVDGANIEDGEDHPVRITWDPNTNIIAVYFDCEFRLAAQVDLIEDIFAGQSEVYWGFTGSTGGSYNNQSVCLSPNIIATGPTTAVCPGGSVELNVSGAPGSDYTWDPPTFLSDPTSPTTNCTPDSSITYSVTYDGFCGEVVTDSIHVEVQELEASFSAFPGLELNCLVESIELAGGSNFPSGIAYNWEAFDSGNIFSSTGATAIVDSPGTYQFTAMSEDGYCSDSTWVEISSNFELIEVELVASETQLDCNSPSVELSVWSDGINAEISWDFPPNSDVQWIENNTALETSTPGIWIITSTHPQSGCTFSDSLALSSDFTFPLVEAGWSDTLTCSAPSSLIQGILVLPSEYSPTLEWSWEEGSMNALDPLAPIAFMPGWYFLMAEFVENGCVGTDSVWVFQDPEATVDASTAQMPNVITPNQDGLNEKLLLFLESDPDFPLLSIVEDYDLQIFNRWGNLIYTHQGSPIEWDARIQDAVVSDGTYYYQLNYTIVCGEVQRGTLTGTFQVFN